MNPAMGYWIYIIFALGGAGIYLLLPRADRSRAGVGIVLALAGLATLMTYLAVRVVAPDTSTGYFYLFSCIAIAAAARVITHRAPVYSAVYFVVAVVAVAALMVLQGAEFLAVALIIVYAGAILVTYLFVIMLAQQSHVPHYDTRSREPFLAVLAGFVLMAAVAGRAGDLPPHESVVGTTSIVLQKNVATEDTPPSLTGNTAQLGALVMTRYVVVLEIAGALLLVSMIGAVAMSRKQVPSEAYEPEPMPLGQVGREAEPF